MIKKILPPAVALLGRSDRIIPRGRRFRRRLLTCFGIAFGVLLIVAVLVTRSLNGLIDDAGLMDDTQQTIGHLRSVIGGMADAEAAQRGFAIAGRESFLRPYYQSRNALAHDMRQIARLTADHPQQRERLPALQRAVDDKLGHVDRLIDMRRQHGEEAARAAVISGVGYAKMENVRRLIEAMIETEEALLRERAERASDTATYTRIAVYSGVAGTFVLMLFISYLVAAESRRRAQAQAELGEANAQLQRSMIELQQVHGEQVLLGTMGELLHSCRTSEEAYDVIERFLPQLFPRLNGALGMLNASRNLVEVVSSWGQPASHVQFSLEECWALRRGRAHFVRSATTDVACCHATPAGEACLCRPLLAQGETGGVLFLSGPPEELTEAARRLARAAGEQLSLALANLRLQETLRIQSVRDPLTGLFNRRYMEASLERELARARRHGHNVSVLMCDIDHFKRFNDTFGHEAGDALLGEFSKLLRGNVREEDIVCRYGGEEFVLILPNTDEAAAVRRADALRQAVRRLRVQHNGQPLGEVTLSLGVGVYPQHGVSPDSLYRSADAALYQAKRGGRDRACVAEEVLAYA
jgi:diguanylate cyclase (GGDEF)-like protein